MVQKIGLFILILWLAACSTQTAVEPTAVLHTPTPVALLSASPTAALPTPTLSTPRLDEAPTTVPEPEQPTAVPTDTVAAVPTETAVPTAAPQGVVYGRTAEGAFFQGYANTPVTMIDYSDFL